MQSKDTRIDFVLEGENGKPVYVEVKSVTLAEELSGGKRIALFPDTVSKRALRHTQHLTQVCLNFSRHRLCISGTLVFLCPHPPILGPVTAEKGGSA